MTEVLFIALTYTCLGLIARTNSTRLAMLAGLVAAAAFLTRGYAIALIPAGIAHIALAHRDVASRERIFRIIAFTTVPVVVVLAWYLYTNHILSNYPLDWVTTRFGTGTAGGEERTSPGYLRELFWYHLRSPVHTILPLVHRDVLEHDIIALIGAILLRSRYCGWSLSYQSRTVRYCDLARLWSWSSSFSPAKEIHDTGLPICLAFYSSYWSLHEAPGDGSLR